ncbi:MAG: division/cell wall cluster transcriptional repressor MraZ [Treponema sp.]|jgi:MraZ protein|nr:division/cell wall cluster transcriptional repressor MraZ [Treponema sp.]
MKSLNGEYKITLDDKGRLSLPSKLRAALEDQVYMLTKGPDGCLLLYPMEEWDTLMEKVRNFSTAFSAEFRALRRRLIGPAQDVELDKAGRIPIPQTLREYAELVRDCIVLGQDDYIEIWNADRHRRYDEASGEDVNIAYEKLDQALRSGKGGQ